MAEVVFEDVGKVYPDGTRAVVLSANSDPADPAEFTLCRGINHQDGDPARQPGGRRGWRRHLYV